MRSKITKKQDFETHHKHFRILGSGQNFPRPMFFKEPIYIYIIMIMTVNCLKYMFLG